MEKILCYALNRIVELENMLLPAIPETVWPAEVELIFPILNGPEICQYITSTD